jgi:hypothetical protein
MSDWQSTLLGATCQADLFVLSTCKYHRKFKRWFDKFRIITYFDSLSLRIYITSLTMKLWLQTGLQTVSSVTISISECLKCTNMYYHNASITHKYLSHIIFYSWSSTRESLGVCTRCPQPSRWPSYFGHLEGSMNWEPFRKQIFATRSRSCFLWQRLFHWFSFVGSTPTGWSGRD